MAEPLIVLRDIKKKYGEDAPLVLKGIDLDIHSSDFIALMGASGSGKSTLMNIIGLLDVPTSGQYFIGGEDASKMDDDTQSALRNRKIGFIFQSFYLIPYLSVLDNVVLPVFYAGEDMAQGAKYAMELLDHFGMNDKYKSKPSELSGGQQQRVAIARAMVNKPSIILADEPTGQLDSKTSAVIMEYIAKLPDTGTAVLLVTHDDFTASFAKKTIRIRDGLLE